jgi:hypothetical protein
MRLPKCAAVTAIPLASSTSLSVATKPTERPRKLASVSASACGLDQRTPVKIGNTRGRRFDPTSQ